MDLDVKYLGVSFDLPLWGLLILSARAPEVVDGLHNDEATQAAMNADANWGMILKIGKLAYEGVEGGCPFKVGDWIFFEDFHPQADKIHDELVYEIPDTRIRKRINDPWLFEPYLNFVTQLPILAERVAKKREALKQRAIEMGIYPEVELTDDIR
jgi:hypothetical protein